MVDTLSGKVAIVTGAGRGIGSAIARGLGRRGATVIVNYASNHEAANKTVAAIEASGGRAAAVQLFLDGEGPVRSLFETTLSKFGRVDILVNNAAQARFGPITSVSEAEFDATMNGFESASARPRADR